MRFLEIALRNAARGFRVHLRQQMHQFGEIVGRRTKRPNMGGEMAGGELRGNRGCANLHSPWADVIVAYDAQPRKVWKF